MIITEKKILKNQKIINLLKNANFIWFLQCQQFKTKELQEFKNKIKNELIREKLEICSINVELIKNKGIIKTITEFFPKEYIVNLDSEIKKTNQNFSFCFQGPTLICALLIKKSKLNYQHNSLSLKEPLKPKVPVTDKEIDIVSKIFQIMNLLHNTLPIFSLKTLNPLEKESINKLGVLLQGFLLIKKETKDIFVLKEHKVNVELEKSIIIPLNLFDYQKLNFYEGKIKNVVITLLSILKTKLIFS